MSAFAPQSTRAGPRLAAAAGAAVLTLVLGISLVGIPGAPDASLDGSWQEMLIHARAHGAQFGRDLIFTWGPWGYLCSLHHLGRVGAVPILAWQTAGQFGIALALVLLTRRLAPWRRVAFAVLFLGFHWLFLDVAYFVLMALIVISGMMEKGASAARLVAWAVVLGFLAQLKFTYMVVASAGVLAAAGCWVGRGCRGRALGAAAGFAAAVFGAWVAAGQDPDNLYPYLRRSLEIASAYGDAMGIDEPWPAFACGAGLALACAALAWTAWRRIPERAFAAGACGYLAFSLLVMWKESFTRADLLPLGGHVFGFFVYVLCLAPVVPALVFPGRRWHWSDLAIPGCLAAVACFDPGYYEQGPQVEWERIYGNTRALLRLGELPQDWERSYEEACAQESLPLVRGAIGDRTVDVYDFNTGVALLNGFRLAPRPIFQSYTAYTPGLEGWNLRFYQSDRAPDFLIWGDQRIDDRYPGQDDAALVAALPGCYAPVLEDGGYWLLKRVATVPRAPAGRRLLLEKTVRLSEEVELPPGRSHPIWLRADPVANDLGRLRALLYKPAALEIATTDRDGAQRLWRVLPRVARDGFILAPTLETGDEVASFLAGQEYSWVRSFHFEAPAGQDEFWSTVRVGVFELPAIELRPSAPLGRLVELGIFDRRPVSVASVFDPEVFDVAEGKAIMLHAEGEVVVAVPAGASRLSCEFGIREGAYTGDGHTSGVRFDLDGVWPGGRRERLWSRLLGPVRSPGDRGTQRVGLAVPADRPERIVLRMEPGLPGDNRWGWSYVASMRFDESAGR